MSYRIDVVRFFFSYMLHEARMDFGLTLAARHSDENPVFLCSVRRRII